MTEPTEMTDPMDAPCESDFRARCDAARLRLHNARADFEQACQELQDFLHEKERLNQANKL